MTSGTLITTHQVLSPETVTLGVEVGHSFLWDTVQCISRVRTEPMTQGPAVWLEIVDCPDDVCPHHLLNSYYVLDVGLGIRMLCGKHRKFPRAQEADTGEKQKTNMPKCSVQADFPLSNKMPPQSQASHPHNKPSRIRDSSSLTL